MRPASGVPGECFSLKDRVDDAIDPTDEDDYVFEDTEEELEAEEEDGDGDYDGGESSCSHKKGSFWQEI